MSNRKTKKGIGADGKTLIQMLEENERLYKETGYYCGIANPTLLKSDPIKAELFHSRLMAALIAGRETTRMVSGSPYVREVAELCLGLYTAEGDNIAQSTGIQIHIRLMGDNIQWMIRKNYEEEVGIHDGDLFIANDPVISGMHAADVYDMLPIFWEKELVCWISTVIMEMDIGAVSPGCMPTPNVERGTDGLKFTCEKIGTKDRLNRDFEHKMNISLDMSDIFLLDRKGAIAANIRVRKEVHNIIREFGIDYFKTGIRELIEEERRAQLARIKQRMIPGRYRSVVPCEFPMSKQPVSWLPAKVDRLRLVPIQMDIETSGRLVLDYEGAGEWGWHPYNATPQALWGGVSIVTVQMLSYDGRANWGSLLPMHIKPPTPDSVLNPTNIKKLATSTPWAPMLDVYGMWSHLLGMAFYLRGFREETFNYRSASGWQMAGYDQMGNKRPLMAAGTGNFGPGACGVCDGVDCGGWLATPEVDLGSVEIWELFVPHMEMARRFEPYSTGYGRFRSGVAIPTSAMLHRSIQCVASGALGCAHDGFIPNLGQFGGYCGGKRNTFLVRWKDFEGMMARREPLLHELGFMGDLKERLQGQIEDMGLIPEPTEIFEGNIMIAAGSAAGGLGDPLERDTRSIEADMDEGLSTKWMADHIYCVKATYNETTQKWKIDDAASKKLRDAKRKERLSKGVPVKDWWKKSRERFMKRDFDPKIVEMYQSSSRLSQPFAQELRDFWSLPDDFIV